MSIFEIFVPRLSAFFASDVAKAMFANMAIQETQAFDVSHSILGNNSDTQTRNNPHCDRKPITEVY